MSDFFHEIINIWRSLGRATTEDIIRWSDTPRPTVDKWFSGQREPNFSQIRRLALAASREKGLNELAAALLPPTFEIVRRGEASANGVIDDEITAITKAAGRIAEAHELGNVAELDKHIRALDAALQHAKAERHLLAGASRP